MSRLVNVAAVVLCGAALSACGTGLEAQTYKARTPYDYTNAELGDLSLRNLAIEAPLSDGVLAKGDVATLTGAVVNTGATDDALTSASSDAAATAKLLVDGSPVTSVPVPASGTSGTTWAVSLEGLTKDLRAGQYVTVTLTFDKAGRTTLQVPVRSGDNGLGDREPLQDPYGEKK